MGRVAKVILGFIAGFFAGYALSIAAFALLDTLGMVHDQNGGIAMSVAFMIGPAVGLILGVAGAVWAGRRKA